MTNWHDDDAFWTLMAPFMFDEARWAGTGAEIELITELTQMAPGTAVLDLGCGPGRHSLELARRGFRVPKYYHINFDYGRKLCIIRLCVQKPKLCARPTGAREGITLLNWRKCIDELFLQRSATCRYYRNGRYQSSRPYGQRELGEPAHRPIRYRSDYAI